MLISRKSFLLSSAATAAALTLAACSGDDSGDASASDASGSDASGEDVTRDESADLVIWADTLKAASLKDAAEKWGESQGITVAVQSVADDLQNNFVTANQAGNGPDIVLGAHDWIGNLVQNGSIAPVNLPAGSDQNFVEVALKAMNYNGQNYGVPYAIETLALYSNKTLTDNTQPGSVEELVEAGKAGGAENVLSLPVGEQGDAYHMEPFYTSGGGYLFGTDADGNFNPDDLGVGAEGSINAGKKIAELAKDGILKTSITGDNAISLFTDGKAAYLVSGPWALANIKEAKLDFDLAQVPGFKDGDPAQPFAGVNGFYIAAGGKNKAFAETFVSAVATDTSIAKAMFEKNQLPPAANALKDELSADYPEMVKITEFAAGAMAMPALPEMAAIWSPLGQAEANIIGGADPEEAMTSAGDEIKSQLG